MTPVGLDQIGQGDFGENGVGIEGFPEDIVEILLCLGLEKGPSAVGPDKSFHTCHKAADVP